MNQFESVVTVALSIIAILLIPSVALLWRIATKWTHTVNKLENLEKGIEAIVEDKDRAHAEIITQMREDRTATNSRLRWLEENLWAQGSKKPEGKGKHAV